MSKRVVTDFVGATSPTRGFSTREKKILFSTKKLVYAAGSNVRARLARHQESQDILADFDVNPSLVC